MKSVPALLLLEWEGRAIGKKTSRRYVLKILHDGGRGLVELGFYEKLASLADRPGAEDEVTSRENCCLLILPFHSIQR